MYKNDHQKYQIRGSFVTFVKIYKAGYYDRTGGVI
jgi:hypothetical protein